MKDLLNAFLFSCSMLGSSAQSNWVSKAPLPGAARHHPVTFVLDGTGYLLSGSANGNVMLKDFYSYDTSSNTWTKKTDFPGLARGFAEAVTYNGKAYFGFGYSQTRAALNDWWEYNPDTDSWRQLASCSCSGRLHPALIATSNGRIYVGAGSSNRNLKDYWEYNVATNTWFKMPDLPGVARHHPFYFGIGTDAYMGLGHGSDFFQGLNQSRTNIYRDWFKFNSLDSSWTQMGAFPGEGRVAGSQAATADYGYVFSGEDETHNNFDTGQVYQYDPVLDKWTEQEPHPGSSRWATSTFIIDRVAYVVGGEDADGVRLNSMIAYDLTLIPNEKEAKERERLTASVVNVTSEVNYRLYPNPANDEVTIQITNPDNPKMIITDLSGKVLINQPVSTESETIDISALNAGIYVVQIRVGEHIKIDKLIVN